MNSFLYVMVDNFPILVDNKAVYEVLTLTPETRKNESASGYFSWREQILPLVDTRSLLELPVGTSEIKNVGVVYRIAPDQPLVLLVVDEVVRIIKLGQEAFLPLPQLTPKISNYFDRVYHDANERRQAFRFRNPLPENVLNDFVSQFFGSQV